MGVEITLFVVDPIGGCMPVPGAPEKVPGTEERAIYCRVKCVIPLGKVGGDFLADCKAIYGEHPCYFYAPGGDGNTATWQDRYSERLYAMPLRRTMLALAELTVHDDWPAHSAALAILSMYAMSQNDNDPRYLQVIAYGH